MNQVVSAWLMLADGENKGKIALQKRSLKNKMFPYVCQATWSGKVEQGEDVKNALKREGAEELGANFFKYFSISDLEFIGINNFALNNKKFEVHNYFAKVSQKTLNEAKLHDEALPDFIFAESNSVGYLTESGKDPKNNNLLFDDQYKILKEIFNGNRGDNK